jgi:hypothetical protein
VTETKNSVQIRSLHPYSYRSGEWATLIGFYSLTTETIKDRECYVVVFDDGDSDLWAVEDPVAEYEFSDASA